MKGQEDTKKKTKDLQISLIVFALITIFTIIFMFYLKKLMPEYMMKQGKRYLEIGHHEKALQLFDMASESLPYSCEPIYYKAITYSKMPPNYENQKMLYDYSKSSDCENISEEVTKILNMMRKYYFKTSGESYIDNVLYKDKLVRWNNNEIIPFFINYNDDIPKYYIDSIRRAFFNWQIATNGEIKFRETEVEQNAKIYINFVDKLNKGEKIGYTTPVFNKNKLSQMRIDFEKKDAKKKKHKNEVVLSVAQHEIGHALGIWGHSANPEDVMYYAGNKSNEEIKVISPRDVSTIITIYKMIPDVIDKPLTPVEKQYLFFHNILTTHPSKNFENETNIAIENLSKNKEKLDKWIELTKDFINAKQYERANVILIKLLPYLQDDKEKKYEILYTIANNYYKLKEYENAKKYLNSAFLIKKDLKAQFLECVLYLKLGKNELAEKQLTVLFNENPTNIDISLKLAEACHINKNKKKEKEVLKALLKNNPNAIKDERVLKYKINIKNKMK